MKISFIILFLLNFAALQYDILHSQKKYSVINAKTGEPIPYATIKILHTEKGAYSDELGEFELVFAREDSILVSSIGYTPTVFVNKDENTPVFKLPPAAQELESVTVKNKKLFGRKILGNVNFKTEGNWYFFWGGEEVAQLVRFPLESDNVFKIKKVIIPIRFLRCNIPLVLHIFSVNEAGLPGKELLSRTYRIGKSNVRRNKAVINVEREDLWINDESIFVMIHAQLPADYNPRNHGNIILPLSYEITDTLTFIRGFFTHKTIWTPLWTIPYLEGKPDPGNRKLINSLFTVEVEEYR